MTTIPFTPFGIPQNFTPFFGQYGNQFGTPFNGFSGGVTPWQTGNGFIPGFNWNQPYNWQNQFASQPVSPWMYGTPFGGQNTFGVSSPYLGGNNFGFNSLYNGLNGNWNWLNSFWGNQIPLNSQVPFGITNPINNWLGGFVPYFGVNTNVQNTGNNENMPGNIPVGFAGFAPFGFVNPVNTCAQQAKAA